MIFSKKATSITCLKRHIAITLIFSLPFLLLGQTESVYKVEFKNVGQNAFTQQLIARSSTAINTNWNNYKGGAMHTDNALFHFNSERLVDAFPTHSAIHTNNYLLYYFSQKTAKCPTLFSLLNYYEPVINENLTKNNLPKELKLLPAVLSAFNPFSNNQMGGTGFWHLNYPQAIKYGLVVNETIDERMDFEKSTKAATACLKDLHEMYNDWELTLTAYATGVVTVSKLLKRHAATTYKEIYPCLPTPTQDMVQAYVAMNYVYNYDTYGAIALNPVLETDTILIAKKVDDKVSYFKKNICKKSIFKNLVYSYNGSLYENNENNLVAFFDSNKKAIECAFSIKTALSKRTDSSFFKIITYRFPQKKNESSIVITISILLLLLHFVKTQKQLIVLTNKQRIVNYLNDDEFINKKEIHLLEPYEESFLFSLMNTLSGNYQNPKFNITNICAIMMMCKTKLYRNCKKITGKSLNQILKEFRLLKAVNSLSICRSTVNEISIDVGFGSSSYFSKCFKKKFGIPPKKILKN